MTATLTRASRSQLAYAALYALFIVAAVTLRFTPIGSLAFLAHALIFFLGPIFVFLDMLRPMKQTRKKHHLETSLRVGILALIYSTVLPGIATANGSLGIVGHLFNFTAMYFSVVLGLHKFAIRPDHWLRYDNRFHTGFIAAMVSSIVLELGLLMTTKGLGLWSVAAMCIGMQLAWRHALWYNASQKMSPAQHADVWPSLAQNNEPALFWNQLYRYSLKYSYAMPMTALSQLSLVTLLGYFKYGTVHLNDSGNYQHTFEECVKKAINEKEPRATFIWQLYPAIEAAAYITRIEEFVANAKTESFELPAL